MAIEIANLHKSYRTNNGWNHVLKGINLNIPKDQNLGILGRNGAGKSTLMSILSNIETADKGKINRNGLKLSWPIGKGGMQGSLTGADNVKFVCRITGTEIKPALDFVKDFSELAEYIDMPVKSYSSGMKSRLAFAMSMAVKFDTYLVDEGFNTGDARFTEKMLQVFSERKTSANMICVSHNPAIIKKFCNAAGILHQGQFTLYNNIDEAIEIYKIL